MTGCLPSLSLSITVLIVFAHEPCIWTLRSSLLNCLNCLSEQRWTSVYVTANDPNVISLHRHSHSIIVHHKEGCDKREHRGRETHEGNIEEGILEAESRQSWLSNSLILDFKMYHSINSKTFWNWKSFLYTCHVGLCALHNTKDSFMLNLSS